MKQVKQMKTGALIIVLFVSFVATSAYAQPEAIKTHIDDLSFALDSTHGYPTTPTGSIIKEVVFTASENGITLPEGADPIHQERAYTSPIWYTP